MIDTGEGSTRGSYIGRKGRGGREIGTKRRKRGAIISINEIDGESDWFQTNLITTITFSGMYEKMHE